MKFGLSDTDYDLLEKIIIKPLKKAGAKVFVFGSRATGKYQPFSDIDLLIDDSPCRQDIRPLISVAREEIEESTLPIKVDVVILNELAHSYLDSVLSERIAI